MIYFVFMEMELFINRYIAFLRVIFASVFMTGFTFYNVETAHLCGGVYECFDQPNHNNLFKWKSHA